MTPYRLISSIELRYLAQYFESIIEQWNQQYSLHPLNSTLKVPPKDYNNQASWVIDDTAGKAKASITEEYKMMMSYSLFGQQASCFEAASNKLFLNFLNQLLHQESCSLEPLEEPIKWIYPGSTCLLLELQCNGCRTSILISPEWVYTELPINVKLLPPIKPLDETLATKSMTLKLELSPINIKINQLIELQLGDVLITDHMLTQPIKLRHEEYTLAHTELGKSSNYKSITIREFL